MHARRGKGFAQRLVQRARDADRFARRFHLGTEVGIHGRQLVHGEDRGLHRHQVPRRHKPRRPAAIGQLFAQHHAGRELDHRHAGDLGQEWHRARRARVDLQHVDMAAVHHVLHVDQAAQTQVARDADRVVDDAVDLSTLQALRRIDRV